MTPKHADLTQYPKLFQNTYWGCWRSEPDYNIISHRNAFVRQYQLIRCLRASEGIIGSLMSDPGFDHKEAYKSAAGGVVCLTSPYSARLPSWALQFFHPTIALYSKDAISYIAHFPGGMLEVRQTVNQINAFQT